MNSYDVILKPLLSEKTHLSISFKRYTFIINCKANKYDVKRAVEEIFNVKVSDVNTVNVRGKLKRQRRESGYTSKFKKAIVQLSNDSKPIEFFESLS